MERRCAQTISAVLAAAAFAVGADAHAATPTEPPYHGTIFIDGGLITGSDPTTYKQTKYLGRKRRSMFDRRTDGFIRPRAFVFKARYQGGAKVQIRVNPEFRRKGKAARQAAKYARVVGRLPGVLRAGVRTITIHRGDEDYGGGSHDLLIHVGRTRSYVRDRILEETLVHEAAHASLDPTHAGAAGWLDAQAADPTFISTYAHDNPTREDVAESFLPYLGIRYRRSRMSADDVRKIEEAIPNRIAYFDAQGFDMRPVAP